MTTKTTSLTIRQALKVIRKDMRGVDYLPGGGPRMYECDAGTLYVRNTPSDGGALLGLFVAELVGGNGQTIRTYKI